MGCSRIMTTNYLDPDIIAASYISSEQAAFPAENLYNAQRRSKVWRSNGYWNIVDGENTIFFSSTSGSSHLAEIVPDEYTSTTAFLQAVKDAMDTADGTYTHTVSQDPTTGRITIESTAAAFNIFWSFAQSEAMGEIMGFDTDSDDTGATTYTADQLRIHTNEWIKWDLGISSNPRALILIGRRNEPIKLSPSAVLTLMGNENNVWTSPSYEQVITYDDEVMIEIGTEGLHTEQLRWWMLDIYDPANPNLYVELGAIFLGDYIQPERGAVQFPLQGSFIDRSTTVFSIGGQSFSDVRQKSERIGLRFGLLTTEEKEQIDDHWDNVGTSYPFFVQLDSNLAFSSRVGKYVRYVKFEGEPPVTLESPGNWSCNMALREEL